MGDARLWESVSNWLCFRLEKKKHKIKIKPCSFICIETSLSFESFDISQQRQTEHVLSCSPLSSPWVEDEGWLPLLVWCSGGGKDRE